MRFVAVDYKQGKIGVQDLSDKVIEYYSPDELKDIIKGGITISGVVIESKSNNMFLVDGLSVNLAYPVAKKFGKWIVAILKKGDSYGSSLSSRCKEDTIAFYDSSVNWDKNKYPYGQLVTSYYLKTFLQHDMDYDLYLDTSVKSWVVESKIINDIVDWLWEVL